LEHSTQTIKKYNLKRRPIEKVREDSESPDIKNFILTDGRYISTNKFKWYDHLKGKFGVGSKTLIDHLLGLNPNDSTAEEILARHFDLLAAKQSIDYYRSHVLAEALYEEREAYCPLPISVEELWPEARLKLIQRGLNENIIDYYHNLGLIYVNHIGYIVFLCQDSGFFLLIPCSNTDDKWWWPGRTAGPFVLSGLETFKGSNVMSPLENSKDSSLTTKKTQTLILTDNPLTALKVKAENLGQKVLAVGPRIQTNVLISQIKNQSIVLAAQDSQSLERLKKTINSLSIDFQ
jgi:hypothetical protein